MTTASDIIEVARSYVGVRYRHQGRDRITGLDCIGLVILIAKDLDLIPFHFERKDYGRLPNTTELEDKLDEYCVRSDRIPGVIVGFRWTPGGLLAHAGVYTGSSLIHSNQRVAGVVEQRFSSSWARRSTGAWRFPGVTYE